MGRDPALVSAQFRLDSMSLATDQRERCPLCEVEIHGQGGPADQVIFSRGTPGSRSKLWARVCQYLKSDAQRSRCINQDPELRGDCRPGDGFEEIDAIQIGDSMPGS